VSKQPSATAPDEEPEVACALGLWALAWRRFRRHRLALVAAAMLLLLALSALLAPWIAPYNPDALDYLAFNAPPSWAHPMGTDFTGRDMLSRVLYGGRVSLLIGVCAMLASVTVGSLLGALAGYFGGKIDTLIMRLTDMVLSFPLYLVLFVLAAFISGAPGWQNVALIVGLLVVVSWTSVARLVRAEFLTLKEREFVEAARAMGAGPAAIITRQLLPNAMAPIVVSATLLVGNSIILESVLSFFGYGVQPPTASWGSMLASGAAQQTAPWETIYPGLMILLTVLSVNLLGDGLRDALDPFSTTAAPRRH
jgi:peptide/nickel transport system permease protein